MAFLLVKGLSRQRGQAPGLLVAEGYPFYCTRGAAHGFSLLAALLLFAVLPPTGAQRARVYR
jgi:hypothetical protein